MLFKTSRTQNSLARYRASSQTTKMKPLKHHRVKILVSRIPSQMSVRIPPKHHSKMATMRPSSSNKYYMKINLFCFLNSCIPGKALYIVVNVHRQLLSSSLNKTVIFQVLNFQRTNKLFFLNKIPAKMIEPRVLKNLLDSVEAKSVLYLDNKQRLDKALALFSGLDICWKSEATLSNGLLEKLLVVGSEGRVSRHHLKDQTA